MKPILFAAVSFLIISCNNGPDQPADPGTKPDGPKPISYSVINTYPHDTSSFTEGLLFYKGELYESTGEKGQSRLMKIDLKTGKRLKSVDLDAKYFGEGIVIVNDTVYMLTYQEKVGFMFSLKDFKKIGEFSFVSPEGWGMTWNGKEIIASDGSSNLYYYQPGTFRFLRTQSITEAGGLAFNINELEYIDGYIYANQWQQPYIFKIDPSSGQIVGKIDLSELTAKVRNSHPYADVLNGIAYDDSTKKIYITGKRWPELYEVKFSQ
ncbi:MAG: glutaminyl-peptide cyclotransferase [Chitinophagaceae bacterium]|nr:glutaminyl-peptide cyclotransferase [Chitinophagaceae bacterium]